MPHEDVFYVFVAGADGADHCFPVLGIPEVDTMLRLRIEVQVSISSSHYYLIYL
jgi:hypothetical protein